MSSKEADELLTQSIKHEYVVEVEPAPPLSLLAKFGLSKNVADLIRKAFAEFLCLTIFVFIGVLVCQQPSVFSIALTHGLVIALLVCTFGHVSGGHINPAVTLGVLIAGQIKVVEAAVYIVAQLLGALFGAFLSWAVMKHAAYLAIVGGAHAVNTNNGKAAEGQCFLLEVVVTFNLVFVVLMCAVNQKNCFLAALAIGFTVAGGIVAAGPLSGGSLNPGRSFGPLVVYSAAYNGKSVEECENSYSGVTLHHCLYRTPSYLWRYSYIHLIGPLVGAAIAAAIYLVFFHGTNDKHLLEKKHLKTTTYSS